MPGPFFMRSAGGTMSTLLALRSHSHLKLRPVQADILAPIAVSVLSAIR